MRRFLLPLLAVSLGAMSLTLGACTPGVRSDKPAAQAKRSFLPTTKFASATARLATELYLASGVPINGSLSTGDERFTDQTLFDRYFYRGQSGESLTIDLTSESVDAYMEIRGANGTAIAIDDDSGEGLNARISVTLPATGTFEVIAGSATPGTGAYQLRLTSSLGTPAPTQPQPQPSGPQAIAAGQRATGSISATDPVFGDMHVDLYTFDAQAGEAYTFSTDAAFDAMLYIGTLSASSFQPAAADDDSGEGLNSLVVFEPTTSGRYTVLMTSVGGATGTYALTMARGGTPMPFTAFTDTDWARRYPGGGDAKGKYAVLVGIADNPPGLTDLPTSVSDVNLMKRSLVEKMGFLDRNVIVITETEATRENIMQAITRHLGQAGPDGTAVFYYSGHGGQTDNAIVADDEPDGKDETLAVYSRRGGVTEILDDELGALADGLRSRNVMFILDSCHSGTAVRDDGSLESVSKALTPEQQALVERPTDYLMGGTDLNASASMAGDPGSTINSAPTARHLLLSAAASSETASSGGNWPDTAPASVFTHFLYKAFMTATPATTFDQLMERVRAQTVSYGRSLPTPSVQTPQIEGRAGTQSLGRFFGIR